MSRADEILSVSEGKKITVQESQLPKELQKWIKKYSVSFDTIIFDEFMDLFSLKRRAALMLDDRAVKDLGKLKGVDGIVLGGEGNAFNLEYNGVLAK